MQTLANLAPCSPASCANGIVWPKRQRNGNSMRRIAAHAEETQAPVQPSPELLGRPVLAARPTLRAPPARRPVVGT